MPRMTTFERHRRPQWRNCIWKRRTNKVGQARNAAVRTALDQGIDCRVALTSALFVALLSSFFLISLALFHVLLSIERLSSTNVNKREEIKIIFPCEGDRRLLLLLTWFEICFSVLRSWVSGEWSKKWTSTDLCLKVFDFGQTLLSSSGKWHQSWTVHLLADEKVKDIALNVYFSIIVEKKAAARHNWFIQKLFFCLILRNQPRNANR